MAKQIISNKVYESLQVPTYDNQKSSGKILYANSFSGVAQVAMPDDIKELLDDDFGLAGNNVLIQLEQKFSSYPNGPWYVDSRDGVIYIHNRKFNEEPYHHYAYQQENGEVLSISFTTREVTKRVKFQLTQTIDPEGKDLVVGTSEIKEPDPKQENPYIQSVDNIQVSNYASNEFEDYRSAPTDAPYFEYKGKNTDHWAAKEKQMKFNSSLREFESEGPVAAYKSGKEAAINNLSNQDLDKAISTAVKQLPSNKQKAITQALDRAKKSGKDPESDIKEALNGSKYLFVGDQKMEYMAEEEVDPREFDPTGNVSDEVAFGTDGSKNPSVQRGMAALENDPMIKVVPNSLSIETTTNAAGEIEQGSKFERKIVQAKVKIRRLKKVAYNVPIYKLYHNLFNRFGGAKNWAKAMQSAANNGLKYTERKQECQMVVVGRPSLESSQILIIDNIGRKWSGAWYIKKCTHMMDAGNGYTCQLKLVRNGAKSGSSTTKATLNTKDMMANGQKKNATTSLGKDLDNNNGETGVQVNFTEQEVTYYSTQLADKSKGNKFAGAKTVGDQVSNVRAWNEAYADDPVKSTMGTVVTTETVTSNGVVLDQKVQVREAPKKYVDKYKDRYNYLDAARKLLQKNQENKK